MKKIIYILALFLFLAACFSLTKPFDKTSALKKKNIKTEFKNRQAGNSKPKVKKSSKKRFLAKEEALPKNHYKAKKSKTELLQEFEKHLQDLKQICILKENKKELLQKQLTLFNNFLKTSLKDPNIAYNIQLLFADINSIFEEINDISLINLDSFTQTYRVMYKLPTDIKIKDYPNSWATTIAESIKCAQQTDKKN